ncbi:hypothetical protein WA026_013037 [Henosepilachna vigintioctopunctata]|uniref:Uncharacterized protein n=1 Tax=Henosepilachna vigintioctopunctata TaxID=420089 RepID=A0AAW1UKV2_9CUCU
MAIEVELQCTATNDNMEIERIEEINRQVRNFMENENNEIIRETSAEEITDIVKYIGNGKKDRQNKITRSRWYTKERNKRITTKIIRNISTNPKRLLQTETLSQDMEKSICDPNTKAKQSKKLSPKLQIYESDPSFGESVGTCDKRYKVN